MTDNSQRPPTAQEYVLQRLRQAIISRELQPGAAIRQELLAEKYGTSRVPLREALKILEGEGHVTYIPHRGYFVADLSVSDLREVYIIRDLLETEALTRAIENVTEQSLAHFTEILTAMSHASASGDLATMSTLNRNFHFGIFELSEMPRLVRLIRVLWDATDAYRSLYYSDADNRAHVEREHQRIMAALVARDADALVSAHRDHRNRAVAVLETLLEV